LGNSNQTNQRKDKKYDEREKAVDTYRGPMTDGKIVVESPQPAILANR
jgi:hypothetical protein